MAAASAWGAWFGVEDIARLMFVAPLLWARLLPLCLLSPWLSPRGGGWVAAGAASAMLSVALLPHAEIAAPLVLPSGLAWVLLFAREVVVGVAFATLVRLPLDAMTMAGRLADRARHGGATNGTEGPLTVWYRWFGVVLFVACGGAELALRTVAEGLSALPVAQVMSWSDLRGPVFAFVRLCAAAMVLGLLLSMPVLLGALLVDVAQAVTQRWLSSWPSSWLWIPLRHVIVIALAMASLTVVASVLPDAYLTSIHQAQAWLDRLTP